ncbi:hypothetical protein J5N97_024563 [Dioscorea zingiberensis]|uniref:RING-type E3 ubiquitin transferase n=1 Tax=Dioscorea zingiberensis TaxID=325984 RepID=A0A9D5C6M9_9LILI|nr:hypothetical protein J5N97_024563 [Dioscorea zingiberensis]
MGNTASGATALRSNSHHHNPHPPSTPQPPPPPQRNQESSAAHRYVFAAATSYPPQQLPNPNPPQHYQYPGYYTSSMPAVPLPLPAPFDHHHRGDHPGLVPPSGGRYPLPQGPPPFVEHQKAVTIRNDINLKKETLRVEPDEQNPGKYLVVFSFNATVAGSITVLFFAKEEFNCNLTATKESLQPVTVHFEAGLEQKFRQPCGTGIDFSMFEQSELTKEGEMEVYPLAVKAETCPSDPVSVDENQKPGTPNSQITQAVFEKKENGEYLVHVIKQILWVNSTRYELQEIYGIGSSVENDFDENDSGKECVICLSEPRDTAVLPCRHMCMCGDCAKALRVQKNRCPICRHPVERLLEIKVNRSEEQTEAKC